MLEIERLVEALNDGGVEYIVIGGLAVAAHGLASVLLEDLIAMKRAAGRPQDLEDLARLTSGE